MSTTHSYVKPRLPVLMHRDRCLNKNCRKPANLAKPLTNDYRCKLCNTGMVLRRRYTADQKCAPVTPGQWNKFVFNYYAYPCVRFTAEGLSVNREC